MSDGEGDPKTFGRSLEWAGDPHYPNIVALTEEVEFCLKEPAPGGFKITDRHGLRIGPGLSSIRSSS